MRLERIQERLVTHRPAVVEGNGFARAAVAVVLREAGGGTEFVAIRRSERVGDPWSGHMALPGGRQHPSDRDLLMTAARETQEEIGVDLARHARLLGRLDELTAMAWGQPIDLVISPFVFALEAPVQFIVDPSEVERAV